MNAATVLSFASLLALVSMSDATFGNDKSRLPTGNRMPTYVYVARTAADIYAAVSSSLRRQYREVAFVSNDNIKRMITTYRSQIPKIGENLLHPVFFVRESMMVLSSVAVPTINFPVRGINLRKSPTSADIIDLAIVIPEITVDFAAQIPQTNGKPGRSLRSRYAFRTIDVQLEITWSLQKNPQVVESAIIKQFEPQSVIVGRAENQPTYEFITHAKGSPQFKSIIAAAKHYIPANFKNGPVVKDFAQKLFW